MAASSLSLMRGSAAILDGVWVEDVECNDQGRAVDDLQGGMRLDAQ